MAAKGRPSSFTQSAADAICERIAGGESLRRICEDNATPPIRTVMAWLAKSEAFQQQYARARELWADAEFDNLMEIADTPLLGEKVKETAVLVDGKPLMGKDGQPILNREVIRGDMIEHRRLRVDARKWALARMSPKKYGDRLGIAGVDDAPLKVEILDKLAAGRARVAKLR